MSKSNRVLLSYMVLGFAVCTGGKASAFSDVPLKSQLQIARSVILAGNEDEQVLARAETFIGGIIQKATKQLTDHAGDEAALKSFFKTLLERDFDTQKIARFSLGRYWRTASKEQQSQYVSLFKDMVVDVYTQRFSEYDGQVLEVRGARAEGTKDILVSSVLLGQDGGPDVKVDWRVREDGGQFKVIDVIVEGVSMALTQRSEFASVIQRGGGDVAVLIAHLQK